MLDTKQKVCTLLLLENQILELPNALDNKWKQEV